MFNPYSVELGYTSYDIVSSHRAQYGVRVCGFNQTFELKALARLFPLPNSQPVQLELYFDPVVCCILRIGRRGCVDSVTPWVELIIQTEELLTRPRAMLLHNHRR